MPVAAPIRLPSFLKKYEDDILSQWTSGYLSSDKARPDLIKADQLRTECRQFLEALTQASAEAGANVADPAYEPVREFLGDLTASRARAGFTPSETATFVFSLKEPVFSRLRHELTKEPQALGEELWAASLLIDKLGLYTTEAYQKTREEVIARQQQELLELSTPVVQLWQGVLALPLIGTLDSARTQVVMESLLQEIVRTGTLSRSPAG